MTRVVIAVFIVHEGKKRIEVVADGPWIDIRPYAEGSTVASEALRLTTDEARGLGLMLGARL